MPQYFLKDPNDVKDVNVNFSDLLPSGVVLTGTATVTPDSGITVDASTEVTPRVIVQLSGGTAGERYDVNVEIGTDASDPETYNRKVVIVVEDL